MNEFEVRGIKLYLGEPVDDVELINMVNNYIFPTHFSFSISDELYGSLSNFYIKDNDQLYLFDGSNQIDISEVITDLNYDQSIRIVSNEFDQKDRNLIDSEGVKISLSDLIAQTISKEFQEKVPAA